MSNKAEIPLKLRRRTHLVDRVIKNLLPNMYPCDYNSSDHFVEGVLDEIRWFLVDSEELQGIERIDIEDYILDYKYDELTDYFNEHCIVLKNDNLQEQIRKVLKEETHFKIKGYIKEYFDNVFNSLNLVPVDDNLLMNWVDNDSEKIFQRNWYGAIWVYNCEIYKDLRDFTLVFSMSIEEFDNNLLEYLNEKYKKEFKNRPLRFVGDENNCLEE